MARGDTTEAVLEMADQYGVSERTAWRWLAAMRATGGSDLLLHLREGVCAYCKAALPDDATLRRRFCDSTCRVYHHRDRHEQLLHQRLAAERRQLAAARSG